VTKTKKALPVLLFVVLNNLFVIHVNNSLHKLCRSLRQKIRVIRFFSVHATSLCRIAKLREQKKANNSDFLLTFLRDIWHRTVWFDDVGLRHCKSRLAPT